MCAGRGGGGGGGGGVWGKGEGQSVLGVVINYLCRVNPLKVARLGFLGATPLKFEN